MKAVLVVVALFFALAAAQEDSLLEVSGCFPDCTWNCDRPSCPAVCSPQCEKPACELRCEKLPQTACDIRCEKPKCEVRCSKKNCAAGGCPICENVCLPAKCQTVCTPAVPKCKPTCSAPKCTWTCKKPSNCPKPKCSLGCAKKPGAAQCQQKPACCPCSSFLAMESAVKLAHKNSPVDEDMAPSFVEVAHELRHQAQMGMEEQCCPCQ